MDRFKIEQMSKYNMDKHRLEKYATYPAKKNTEKPSESFKEILRKLSGNR